MAGGDLPLRLTTAGGGGWATGGASAQARTVVEQLAARGRLFADGEAGNQFRQLRLGRLRASERRSGRRWSYPMTNPPGSVADVGPYESSVCTRMPDASSRAAVAAARGWLISTTQNILVRGGSAYCSGKVIAAVVKAGALFSFAIAGNPPSTPRSPPSASSGTHRCATPARSSTRTPGG
jgi:hypothetical protein